MILNNHEYKTVLLDTNILREFIFSNSETDTDKQKKKSLLNFITRFLIDEPHVILISCYSILELYPYKDLFIEFYKMYSYIPFFIVFPEKIIIEEEYTHFKNKSLMVLGQDTNRVIYAITYLANNLDYFLNTLFLALIDGNITNFTNTLRDIAQRWELQRKLSNSEIRSAEFYKRMERKSIENILKNFIGEFESDFSLSFFPGTRLMLYTQYKKVHLTNRMITMNDVVDVRLSCIVPYVDFFITENQQANFLIQSKKIIPQMKNVNVLTLKDIRS